MTTTSICVPSMCPSCLLPLQEDFWDQQLGLTSAPFELLLLPWVSQHVRLCARPVRAESLFPTSFWLSPKQVPLAFKARHCGSSYSQCRTPGLGRLMWGLNTSVLGENLWNCDYPPAYGLCTRGYGSWLYCIFVSPACLVVVPSLYL